MSSLSSTQPDDLDFSPSGGSGAVPPERELVARARDGDRAAFAHIVTACQDRLYNAVLRLVGDYDEAREIVQETFARALEKLPSFRGESGAYTWLFRIAMNLAISQFRKQKRHRAFSLDRPDGWSDDRAASGDQAAGLVDRIAAKGTVTPIGAASHREEQSAVLLALGRLEPEQRALLVMRDIDGMDYAQMAGVLDVPLGTLKSKLFRARVALKDEMK